MLHVSIWKILIRSSTLRKKFHSKKRVVSADEQCPRLFGSSESGIIATQHVHYVGMKSFRLGSTNSFILHHQSAAFTCHPSLVLVLSAKNGPNTYFGGPKVLMRSGLDRVVVLVGSVDTTTVVCECVCTRVS